MTAYVHLAGRGAVWPFVSGFRLSIWLALLVTAVWSAPLNAQSSGTAVSISYLEGNNPVASDVITAWGPDMFGDKVNLFNGALTFEQTDIKLPGNSALPVALVRSYAPGRSDIVRGQFGRWDLEVPRIGGTFSSLLGWVTTSRGTNRCTGFSLPPLVSSSGSAMQDAAPAAQNLMASPLAPAGAGQQAPAPLATSVVGFIASDYWQGTNIIVPGHGSQEVLVRAQDYPHGPQDGLTYPLLTRNNWQISCLGSIQNAAGEGFIAISPEGVRYRFDWMATRIQPEVKKSGSSTGRTDFYLLATLVSDRFGNWVSYTYDPANPYLLKEIRASDGRLISLANSGGRTVSASDGTRTFTYGYDGLGDLHNVTLPDGSAWTFNLWGMTATFLGDMGEGANCDFPGALPSDELDGFMTHPSGATGKFSTRFVYHGRTYVDRFCKFAPNSTLYTTGAVYPRWVGSQSLTAKTISGPGMATQTWTYQYGGAAGWNPCAGCADRKIVIVREPSGTQTAHEFGIRWRVNEGQLLRVSEGWTGSGYLKVTDHRYRGSTGQNYPEQYGTSLLRNSDWLASRNRPMDQKVTSQQSTSFTWQVNAAQGGFDTFMRPLSVDQFSSLGHSKTETTRYKDFPALWVNGQKESAWLAATGAAPIEAERHEYNDSTGLKTASYSFGLKTLGFAYNTDGTLATLFDAANRPIQFQNFMRGKPQRAVFADGSVASRVVNNLGGVAAETNEAGTTTTYAFDAMGRVSQINYPTGDPVAYLPTLLSFAQMGISQLGLEPGHWMQVVSTGRAVQRRYYDAQWRLRLQSEADEDDPAGTAKVVVYRYDADGRKAFESYPQRSIASVDSPVPGRWFEYDALDRLVTVRADSELGTLATATAYLAGFKKQVTNANGAVTRFSYQAFDTPSEERLSQIELPLGAWVTIPRDVFGKALGVTRTGSYGGNTQSVTRNYVYDSFARLCKTVEPESGATIIDYDAANLVAWRASGQGQTGLSACDRLSVPASAKVNFSYDARDRLTWTVFGDGSRSIERRYWPDGLLKHIFSDNVWWTYHYNNRRLPTHEEYTWWTGARSGEGWNLFWDYDERGNVRSLRDPWGTMDYAPNALGQPTKISGYVKYVSYHPNGAVAGYTLDNDIRHTLSQNVRGLPEELRDIGVTSDRYSYDANGNVTGILDQQEGVASRTLGYDALDRLTVANGIWGSGSFSYDALDNLRSSTVGGRSLSHNVDTNNRLISLSGSQNLGISYDINGNVTQRGGQAFSFNIGNQLLSAPGKVDSYLYDGHGRRSQAFMSDGTWRLYAYGRDGKLRVSHRSDQAWTRHIYLGDKLIAETMSAATTYVHTDALGSPVARTNAIGALLSRTRYEPYGATAGGANPTGIGFTGHVNDADTGLVYMQHRYYDPMAGRFLSVDPVVTNTSTGAMFNRYDYANNNPYRYTDPDGRVAVIALPFASRLAAAALEKAVTKLLQFAAVAMAANHAANNSGSGSGSNAGASAAAPSSAANAPAGANSPDITPDDLRGKSQGELEQQAKDKGLVQDQKRPNKWRDPVTGDERMRIDPGHVDPKTGQPYDNPRAARPHVHGYDPAGNKIRDPLAGNDPHFPIRP